MKADLHCHSHYSDGVLPVSELVRLAREAGADAFALTDHDTVAGVSEARAAALKEGMAFVSGVEISSYYSCNVHVLGYKIDGECKRFKEFEKNMALCRGERVKKILDKFAAIGMPLRLESVLDFCMRSPSRGHVARAAVAAGYAPDIFTVFKKFLKEGAPCYVPTDFLTPLEAVRLINDCKGVAVLAHPVRLKIDLEKQWELVAALKEEGLRGIEASYKCTEEGRAAPYYDMAKRLNLFVTNGGDFHSPERSVFCPRALGEECERALFG